MPYYYIKISINRFPFAFSTFACVLFLPLLPSPLSSPPPLVGYCPLPFASSSASAQPLLVVAQAHKRRSKGCLSLRVEQRFPFCLGFDSYFFIRKGKCFNKN